MKKGQPSERPKRTEQGEAKGQKEKEKQAQTRRLMQQLQKEKQEEDEQRKKAEALFEYQETQANLLQKNCEIQLARDLLKQQLQGKERK